ncbi:MAG: DUF1638 domain-containing protein [Chloroflexota bacterium]
MKIKALTCDALARPAYWCAAQSPHVVDIELLRFGLHNTPQKLRGLLQARLAAAGKSYDAVVLAYGLCGSATAGLKAIHIPLVIPRAHDCITLFLGSRRRYQEAFEKKPGTYWYVQDYIERGQDADAALSIGSGMGSDLTGVYEAYVQQYGEDNAAYLMEVMGAWQQHYQRAAWIEMGIGDETAAASRAQAEAERRGWAFERLAGDMNLIRQLLWGEWNENFLIVRPGEGIAMCYDEDIVCNR